MTLTGDVVLDIVQHYVERWNEVKKRKVNELILLSNNELIYFLCSTVMMRKSAYFRY